jgi:hypothetical protein
MDTQDPFLPVVLAIARFPYLMDLNWVREDDTAAYLDKIAHARLTPEQANTLDAVLAVTFGALQTRSFDF